MNSCILMKEVSKKGICSIVTFYLFEIRLKLAATEFSNFKFQWLSCHEFRLEKRKTTDSLVVYIEILSVPCQKQHPNGLWYLTAHHLILP